MATNAADCISEWINSTEHSWLLDQSLITATHWLAITQRVKVSAHSKIWFLDESLADTGSGLLFSLDHSILSAPSGRGHCNLTMPPTAVWNSVLDGLGGSGLPINHKENALSWEAIGLNWNWHTFEATKRESCRLKNLRKNKILEMGRVMKVWHTWFLFTSRVIQTLENY